MNDQIEKPRLSLTMYEADALKQVRELLIRKPEAVMQYLSGQVGDDNKGLIALALSAQLNHSKMQLASMQLCKAVAEHVRNLNKESKDEARDH